MDNLDILSVSVDKVGELGINVIFSDKNTGKKYRANIFTFSKAIPQSFHPDNYITHPANNRHEPKVDLHEYIEISG
jgi:hypothetical protein